MPGPFDLNDAPAYAAWRERKLDVHPRSLAELIVEAQVPRDLTGAERAALLTGWHAATWRSMPAGPATMPTRRS